MNDIEEILRMVHDLNDARTVNKVCNGLIRKATELITKQSKDIEDLAKRLDAFLVEAIPKE